MKKYLADPYRLIWFVLPLFNFEKRIVHGFGVPHNRIRESKHKGKRKTAQPFFNLARYMIVFHVSCLSEDAKSQHTVFSRGQQKRQHAVAVIYKKCIKKWSKIAQEMKTKVAGRQRGSRLPVRRKWEREICLMSVMPDSIEKVALIRSVNCLDKLPIVLIDS